MAISEIEKLERRYAENPQGLTFAPLAEVHRKNGDVNRALELLRPGLELHPNYIPASIVLGRCHLDLAELPAAEAAFTRVLSLDGENVIALKALADINERLMRFDDAERWLHQLLSVDRSNDDAREQLERVDASRRQAEVASSVNPEVAAAQEPAGATVDGTAAEPEPAAVGQPDEPAVAVGAESEPVAQRAPEAEPQPREVPELEVVSEETRIAWVSGGEADTADVVPIELEGLETTAPASDELEPRPEGIQLEEPVTLPEPVEPIQGLVGRDDALPGADEYEDEFRVETSEDIVLRSAGGSEYQVPNAAEELVAARGEPASLIPPLPFEEDAPVPAAAPQPEPMLVETMVEMPAPAASAEPATPQVRRAFSARDTGGQAVVDFFRGLLAARPPAPPPVPAARTAGPTASHAHESGAPTRPAPDALSLSSVFGEESSPTPPAVPAPEAPAPGGVSFDQFFGQPGSAGASRAQRAPDSKSDDLDQFHAWLQNLKR